MPFKFKKSQCVMVPGADGVQGRIASRTDAVEESNVYQVAFLDEKLQRQTKEVPEDELVTANATPEPAGSASLLPDVAFTNETPAAPRPSRKRRAKKRKVRR